MHWFDSWRWVSWLLPSVGLLLCRSYDKYFIRSFLFDSLCKSIAAGAFILDQSVEKFDKFDKALYRIGGCIVNRFSIFFLGQLIVILSNGVNFLYFAPALLNFSLVLLFGFFIVFVKLYLLQFPHFPCFCVGVCFPKEGCLVNKPMLYQKEDNLEVLFDSLFDSELMALKASHSEEF